MPEAMAEEFTLSSTVAAGTAVIVSALSPKAGNWYGPAPGLPSSLKLRPCGSSRIETSAFNLKSADDAELIRWGNTLKHWREPTLNHFDNHTTNGFTEGCHTKIKMLKRVSYGLKNVEVYWRKMLLEFVPSRSCFPIRSICQTLA
jgi:hypothetical protein